MIPFFVQAKMSPDSTILVENAKVSNHTNEAKRAKSSTENNSLLQLFVESQWGKKKIHNLGEWLSSQSVDINSKDWFSLLLQKNKSRGNETDDSFQIRVTSELKNILPFLIKSNGDINFTNDNGQTILHVYLANSESDYGILARRNKSEVLKIVKLLIEKGASVNSVDNWGNTPLHVAAGCKKLEIVKLMLDFCTNVDICDGYGDTVLHTAIRNNSFYENLMLDIAKRLLSKGSDLNRKNREGRTPLQLAMHKCDVDFLQICRENGADFTVLTKSNENLLHLFCAKFHENVDRSTLDIFNFLISQGCDVNGKKYDDYTPLHYAASRVALVEQLIKSGADVNCHTKTMRNTPLHCAVEGSPTFKQAFPERHRKSIMALLRAGADVDAVDVFGHAPLYQAHWISDTMTFGLLLDFGADIDNPEVKELLKRRWQDVKGIVCRHADKMRSIGFHFDRRYECHLDENEIFHNRLYRNKCVEEVDKLKSTIIINGVSFYEFLHMNWRRQLAYVELLPQDLESQFPCYANVILRIRNEAVRKSHLLEPAKMAWYQSTKIYLPNICVERIFDFLSNCSLKVLIDAAEMTSDTAK